VDVADVLGSLAALSASVTALAVLGWSGLWRLSRGLVGLALASAAGEVLILSNPTTFWSVELFLLWNCGLALMGTLAALELGRGVMRPAALVWRSVCRRAALLLVPLALIGVFGFVGLAGTQRVGYRGLFVLDVAVAGLLAIVLVAISLYEFPRHALIVTALRGLMRFFAMQALCLGAWELGQIFARAAGFLAYAAYVWAMLAIARDVLASTTGSVLQTVRVTK
jgi:hypothetical protein